MKQFFGHNSQNQVTQFGKVDYKISRKKLHNIAISGDVQKLNQLKIIDPNIIDKNSRTPLHLAAAMGHVKIVEILIDVYSARHTIIDCLCRTPLLTAVFENQTDCVIALLKRGADPRATDKYGNNSLHYAGYFGNVDIAKAMGNKIQNLFTRNKEGNTPLHLAVSRQQKNICELFVRHNCNLDVQNDLKETPLAISAKNMFDDISRLFLLEGANPRIVDNFGKSGVTYFADCGNFKIMKLIRTPKSKKKTGDQKNEENVKMDIQLEEESMLTCSANSNVSEMGSPSFLTDQESSLVKKSDISPPSLTSDHNSDIPAPPDVKSESGDLNEQICDELMGISQEISEKYNNIKKYARDTLNEASPSHPPSKSPKIMPKKNPRSSRKIDGADLLNSSQEIITEYRALTDHTKKILSSEYERFDKIETEIDQMKIFNKNVEESVDSLTAGTKSLGNDISGLRDSIFQLSQEFEDFKLPMASINERLNSLESHKADSAEILNLDGINEEKQEIMDNLGNIKEMINEKWREGVNKEDIDGLINMRLKEQNKILTELITEKMDKVENLNKSYGELSRTVESGFDMVQTKLPQQSQMAKERNLENISRLNNIEEFCKEISKKLERSNEDHKIDSLERSLHELIDTQRRDNKIVDVILDRLPLITPSKEDPLENTKIANRFFREHESSKQDADGIPERFVEMARKGDVPTKVERRTIKPTFNEKSSNLRAVPNYYINMKGHDWWSNRGRATPKNNSPLKISDYSIGFFNRTAYKSVHRNYNYYNNYNLKNNFF